MVNEVTPVELCGLNNGGQGRRYTCAAAVITKGTILKLTDPRTAAQATLVTDIPAGIASMDTDGTETNVTAWTNGVFECKASGAIAVGQYVTCCTDNFVRKIQPIVDASMAYIFGIALETASDAETINVRVNL